MTTRAFPTILRAVDYTDILFPSHLTCAGVILITQPRAFCPLPENAPSSIFERAGDQNLLESFL